MLIDKGKKTINEARKDSSFFKKLLTGSIVANIILCSTIAFVVLRSNVIITPPIVSGKYKLNNQTANERYLVDMAEYVITTLRTVNPDNVDNNNKIILRMTDADELPRLRRLLDSQAERIKKEDISTVWSGSLNSAKVIVNENTVYLEGRLKTYYTDKLVSNEAKKYKIQFDLTGVGTIYVKKVQEINDSIDNGDGK